MSVISFEDLLQRMLARVPDTFDKREGSIIYDALAPAAAELVQAYIELEGYLDLVFVDTSEGDYLTRLCGQFGIDREAATFAVRKGVFLDGSGNNFNVPIGSRFTIETLSYQVTSKLSDGVFKLMCEQSGTIGNMYFGKLVPIDYIEGLGTATLSDVLILGENEETDDLLKERYFEYIKNPAFGGNIADYKRKVKALDGVGACKVSPVWNGPGTVKLILLASDYSIPTQALIDSVNSKVSPGKDDHGLGIAPIGHTVTVIGAQQIAINISSTVTISSTHSQSEVTSNIESIITRYLNSLKEDWECSDSLIVRIAHIESKILDVEGVVDVSNTMINDSASNVTITSENVPALGTVVITYAT